MPANTQRSFYTASSLDPELIHDLLQLVSVNVSVEIIRRWSRNERIIAGDYAIRAHLRASDNPAQHRDKPWFVEVAQDMTEATAAVCPKCGTSGCLEDAAINF